MNTLTDIEQLLAPSKVDVPYEQQDQLKISLILRMDSYKFSHPFAYPEGIQAQSCYGEARVKGSEIITPFGMQILCKRYLTETINMNDVDQAEKFSEMHFGRKLFHRSGWEKVVTDYAGKLPLIIRSVPEGMSVRGGQPIYTVTVIDSDLFWMAAAFETMIQRAVWYPTTVATMDHKIKSTIKEFYEKTGANMDILPFSLHDFGGRGVTCAEQAEIGGAAHLVHFMGSDTVEGILAANFFYKEDMSAFSVYATEHAIECSFGGSVQGARDYIRTQLKNAVPGSIMSMVIDGYDVYREAELLCTEFRNDIIACGAKIVFRPDSGDMMEVVPRILQLQEAAFGYTLTSKGYKQIKHVGIIQGDGVNHAAINELLSKITEMGYSADCVVFGSGGALLQKMDRDSLKFAQKASSIYINGKWVGISKDPVTDPGKKSKEGLLTLARRKLTNEIIVARLDQEPLNDEFEDLMNLVYYKGVLFNETSLKDVRNRANT